MPPKLRRPAAAPARVRRAVRRRPGIADPAATPLEKWLRGEEVKVEDIPIAEWGKEAKVIVTEGKYFGAEATVCGIVQGFSMDSGFQELRIRPTGTETESLLKWSTGAPLTDLRIHLCPHGCPGTPEGPDLMHASKMRLGVGDLPMWTDNLKAEVDDLANLRARQAEDALRRSEGALGGAGPEKKKEKRDKKEKKKKKDKKVTRKEKKKKNPSSGVMGGGEAARGTIWRRLQGATQVPAVGARRGSSG